MFYDFIYLAKGFRMRPKVRSTLNNITRLNKIITRLYDLLCRLNKLLILFIQDNNLCKRLIMSFEQVIYLV